MEGGNTEWNGSLLITDPLHSQPNQTISDDSDDDATQQRTPMRAPITDTRDKQQHEQPDDDQFAEEDDFVTPNVSDVSEDSESDAQPPVRRSTRNRCWKLRLVETGHSLWVLDCT